MNEDEKSDRHNKQIDPPPTYTHTQTSKQTRDTFNHSNIQAEYRIDGEESVLIYYINL